MINVIQGNMVQTVQPQDNILKIQCQGCNTQGRMGSGIALEFRNTYPEVYNVYETKFKESGLVLGESTVAFINKNEMFQVWNMNTQEFYRGFKHKNGVIEPADKVFVDYYAVQKCFIDLNTELTKWVGMDYIYKDSVYSERTVRIDKIEVNFPKIGAGLANGDWNVLQEIIDSTIDDQFVKNLWVLP